MNKLEELKKHKENGAMTKLEELKATYDAAYEAAGDALDARDRAYWVYEDAEDFSNAACGVRDDAREAYMAELEKTQEGTLMTKLEELKAAADAKLTAAMRAAAYAANDAACYATASDVYDSFDAVRNADIDAAWDAYRAARDAYEAELKKHKEKQND
jgi:hypothetical protein